MIVCILLLGSRINEIYAAGDPFLLEDKPPNGSQSILRVELVIVHN